MSIIYPHSQSIGDVVNIKSYGAVGDGVTDDTAAIQAAITAAGTFGSIYVPRGTFILTDKISLLDRQNLHGSSWGSRLKWTSNSNTVNILVEDYVEIANLAIEGDGKTGSCIGISLRDDSGSGTFSRGRINRVRIRDCDVGIAIADCHIWEIVDCNIYNCTYGLHFGYAWQTGYSEWFNAVNVRGGEIQSCEEGIHCTGTGSNNKITEVTIEGCDNYGIHQAEAETSAYNGFYVTRCYFELNGIAHIYYEDYMRGAIENCHFSSGAQNSYPIIIGGETDTGGYPIGVKISRCTYGGDRGRATTVKINQEAVATRVDYSQSDNLSTYTMVMIDDNGDRSLINREMSAHDSPPSSSTWLLGEVAKNALPDEDAVYGWICVQPGSFDTYTAKTADTTNGSDTITINSNAGVKAGHYISIAGITGTKRILDVSGTTLTLDSSCDDTVNDGAVQCVEPVFQLFGAIWDEE